MTEKNRRLTRRVYNVTGVNHLWHIDTNHKLIRWHFVVVGAIDGFSRFVTVLNCADNNKADTVLKCFVDGVHQHGLPLRVRSDKGLENISVAEYMIRRNGPDTKAMITGKSTHNQRIERLWRDVFEGVLYFYYNLFYFLEDEGILDIMNDLHIFALHHVFLSKICDKLNIWKKAWNTHRIRTVKSSPSRIFTAGSFTNPVPFSLTGDEENYGVEGLNVDGIQRDENERPIFDPPTVLDYNRENLQQVLDLHCPKHWTSENFGIDVYTKALRVLEQHNQ